MFEGAFAEELLQGDLSAVSGAEDGGWVIGSLTHFTVVRERRVSTQTDQHPHRNSEFSSQIAVMPSDVPAAAGMLGLIVALEGSQPFKTERGYFFFFFFCSQSRLFLLRVNHLRSENSRPGKTCP